MNRGVVNSMSKSPNTAPELSFEDLFNNHYRLVASAIRLTVGPSDEWEDLVQVAFMEVYKSLGRFEGRSSLSTWVYKIAFRVGLQHRRRLQRLKWLSLFHTPTATEEFAGPHPVARLESREALRALDSRLQTLTEAKRLVFVLSDIHGLTNTEIAEVLDINANTVRSRLHAARTEVLAAHNRSK